MGLVELSLNHSTNLTPSASASGWRSPSCPIGQVRLHGMDADSPSIADTLRHGPEIGSKKLIIIMHNSRLIN